MTGTACRHSLLEVDGESVCALCGAVDDARVVDRAGEYDSSPAPNLFLSRSVGTGKEIPRGDRSAAGRYFRGGISPQRNLSCFSNACQKIGVSDHVRQDAWRMFRAMCRKAAGSTAEHACVSLFHACREGGTSVTEDEIVDAVMICFGRKSMPSMTRMNYRHMGLVEYGRQCGGEDRYYFNVVLRERTAGLSMPEQSLNRRKRDAWFLFTEIFAEDDNRRRRARRSVDMAFGLPRRRAR